MHDIIEGEGKNLLQFSVFIFMLFVDKIYYTYKFNSYTTILSYSETFKMY